MWRVVRLVLFVVAFTVGGWVGTLVPHVESDEHEALASQPAERNSDRWYALDPREQAQYLQLHREISQRGDQSRIWDAARDFARADHRARERMRRIVGVTAEVIRRQPPTQRGALLTLPPRARALMIYNLLRREEQDLLTRLQGERD